MEKKLTHAEWLAEGKRRFGGDFKKWRFVCPVCGFVQSAQDYYDAGAPSAAVAFSCVGRWRKDAQDAMTASPAFTTGARPCNYTGGGLFRLNPVIVVMDDGSESQAFEFAKEGP